MRKPRLCAASSQGRAHRLANWTPDSVVGHIFKAIGADAAAR
jgi:hypothetical protein